MADNDGDSHMDSPPDLSDTGDVETAAGQLINSAILSPPDSQHRGASDMPTSAPGANSNGKRPLNTMSNGVMVDLTGGEATSAKSKTRSSGQDFAPKTHAASGYTWSKHEDEPGYGWNNKKALDERQRAWDGLMHKHYMIKNRYGDPFEMAEKEQAIRNSLNQR